MNINYICDQCHFKGTQVSLKSWDPIFLVSDRGNYEIAKKTIKKVFKVEYFFYISDDKNTFFLLHKLHF